MVVRRTQEEDEVFFVTAFLAATGAQGTPERQPPGEGPDFLIGGPLRRIGLEVTEIYREGPENGMSRRQIEGIRDQILAGAKHRWDAQGGVPLDVTVSFNANHTPAKAEIPLLAAHLANLIHDHLPAMDTGRRLEWDWQNPELLPESINFLSIVRVSTHTRSYWNALDVDYLPPLTPAVLQARIDAKNAKYSQYAEVVEETWLLLVLDGFRLSAMFDVPSFTLEEVYESPFERTLLFDTFKRTVRDLKTQAPGAGPAA